MNMQLIITNFFLVAIIILESNGATLHCEENKDCAANACAPLCYPVYGGGGMCGCAEANFDDLAHTLSKTLCVDGVDCAETECTPSCSSNNGTRGKCGCYLAEVPEGEGDNVYCTEAEECLKSASDCSPVCGGGGMCECQKDAESSYHRSSETKECNKDQDCTDKYECGPHCNPSYGAVGMCACKLQTK